MRPFVSSKYRQENATTTSNMDKQVRQQWITNGIQPIPFVMLAWNAFGRRISCSILQIVLRERKPLAHPTGRCMRTPQAMHRIILHPLSKRMHRSYFPTTSSSQAFFRHLLFSSSTHPRTRKFASKPPCRKDLLLHREVNRLPCKTRVCADPWEFGARGFMEDHG